MSRTKKETRQIALLEARPPAPPTDRKLVGALVDLLLAAAATTKAKTDKEVCDERQDRR